ncbi:MAG: glycosyltransferase family 4 protein [Boseongicola sp.]
MKLLIVSAYFETHRGGIERVAGMLARALSKRGIEVVWLAANSTPPRPIENVELVEVRANNWVQGKLGVPVPIWGPRALVALWKSIGQADILMLHDTLYTGNVAAYLISRLRRKPIVIVQHVGSIAFSNRILRSIMWIGDRIVGRRMLSRADQVVFISERIQQEFGSVRFRRTPEIIFNGVDTTIFRPANDRAEIVSSRRRLGIPEGFPVVLFAGRFVSRKGLELVHFLAANHSKIAFLLAGWGPIDPLDWKLANVYVTSADTAAEMCAIFQASDCLLLPSTGEGFPLVVQEALSTGLPIIISSETAEADKMLSSWIEHAPVDPDDVLAHRDQWSKILDRMIDSLEFEDQARRSDRAKFAEARYGWDVAADKYRRNLRNLSGS